MLRVVCSKPSFSAEDAWAFLDVIPQTGQRKPQLLTEPRLKHKQPFRTDCRLPHSTLAKFSSPVSITLLPALLTSVQPSMGETGIPGEGETKQVFLTMPFPYLTTNDR